MRTLFRPAAPTLLAAAAILIATTTWPEAARGQLRTEDLRFYGGAHLALPVSLPAVEEVSYDAGGGLSLGLSVRVADRWALRVSGSLSRLGLQSAALSAPIGKAGEDPSDGALYRTAASLSLQRFFSGDDDLRFYLLGGVGWDRYDADFSSLAGSRGTRHANGAGAYGSGLESAVSIEGGVGLLAPLSYTAAFFVEPRYRLSFTTGEQSHFVPITVGVVLGKF